MYRALYRKYRPSTFSTVIGQPQVTETLKNEIISGRIAHAYLFTGSRGIGKTSCARILAKAVNCLHPVNGDPCNECEICRGIDNETIMDVIELDAASNNGVGNVRDLQEELCYLPAQAKYRVYIIDEVHMMSGAAFNALLKTLEEPPAHVVFILATTELHKLPATILSRCQRHDFRRVDVREMAEHLINIAKAENAGLDEDGALLIARVADGGMRDAVSLLDQCLSVTENVTEDTVRLAAGLAGREHIHSLAAALAAGDAAGVMERIAELHSMSKDMARLCEELIDYYRSLMLINTVKQPENLIIASREELDALRADAKNYSVDSILHILDQLQKTVERMSRGADRRTELELTMMRLLGESRAKNEDGLSDRLDALSKRLAVLEKAVAGGVIQQPKPSSGGQSLPVPNTEVTRLSDNAVLFDKWGEVLGVLEKESVPVYSLLLGSRAYRSGQFLLIEAGEAAVDMLKQDTIREIIKKTVFTVTGDTFKLGPYRPTPHKKQEEPNGAALLAKLAEESGIKQETNE